MSEVDNTQQFSDSSGPINADPLGIVGWEIGGKYKIRSYLGGGGFGEVYDAYNLNLVEQRLVVKFFKRVQARDRFDREARVLCMLDHPNISRVIDYLPDEGALVIQYIDGKDGSVLLRESGALEAELYLNVARSVTDAIAYAHDKKIAHRDIKPANILVDLNKHVYLIDFGIAKEIGGGDQTKTGYQALTPMFAAPERQTGGSAYNPFLSDIYEMGITLFNFATNSMPYRNPIAPTLEEWGGIHSLRLSPELRYVLKKATHPDPTQRYQTAAEMAAEVRALKVAFVSGKKRPKGLLVAAAVVVVAAAAYFGSGYIGEMFTSTQSSEAISTEEVAVPAEQPDETAQELPVVVSEAPAGGDQAGNAGASQSPTTQTQRSTSVEVMAEAAMRPSAMPELTISVEPAGVQEMYVDGRKRTPGRSFETQAGSHTVEITHADYPVLRKTLRMTDESADITYELRREFVARDTLSVQLALYPFSDQSLLEVQLNGRSRRYTQFPVLDLNCLAGDWNFEAALVAINIEGAEPKIDSCIAFPYGGGPKFVLKGSKGLVQLSGGESGNIVPLLIYWSQ